MNLLTDRLPTSVFVNDEIYEIDSDFRTCIKIIMAFEDKDLAAIEKQIIMLNLLYCNKIPKDAAEACHVAVRFLNCGEINTNSNEPTDKNIGRLYSFEKDSQYIFTAINQTHSIDIEQIKYLHWWKFSALFLDLKEECFFCRLMYLRKQKRTGKMTKEEREWYYSIKDIVDLEDDEIHDENLDEFMALLNNNNSVPNL